MNSVRRLIARSAAPKSESPMSAITVIFSSSIRLSRAKSRAEVTGASGSATQGARERVGRGGTGGRASFRPRRGRPADEVVEPDVAVVVVADPQVLARRVDAPRRVELGREDPEVDVGQEAAEHQQAVGRLDALGDLGAAHRPLVDADEERVPLGDHALAQDRRGDRHAGLPRPGRAGRPGGRSGGSRRRPGSSAARAAVSIAAPRRAPRGARRGRSAAGRRGAGAGRPAGPAPGRGGSPGRPAACTARPPRAPGRSR